MPVNAPNDNLDVLAPSFNLKNIDDEMVSLDKVKGLNGTVIVFICNHCPYVKAIASRLKKDADELLEHSINTIAIMSNDVINYPDDSFDNMKENLKIISLRLINQKGINNIEFDAQGYPIGFSQNSQEVLVPAFISAYTGNNANSVGLNPISDKPKINWSIQYDVLSEGLKDIFSRISLRHSYRSNFTINNFQSNLNYSENSFNSVGDYESKIFFSNINLVEQFNPLIRVDLELKNSLRLSFDVIKDRAVSLSLANNLITESWGDEYSIGIGYRARNLKLWSRFASTGNRFIGDLNTKLDFNIRKNMTVIRNLNIDDNKVSAGQSVFSLRISADYALNRNFSTIFFYDHLFSKYEISTAFPQTNIRSGFTLRYNFGN